MGKCENTPREKGDAYHEKDIDRMLAANGEKVNCVVIWTCANDMNEGGVGVLKIHG